MATSVRADLARLVALLPALASRYGATIAWDTATNRDVAFTLTLLGEVAEEGSLQLRTFNLLNVGEKEGVEIGEGSTVSEAMSEEVELRRSVGEGANEGSSRARCIVAPSTGKGSDEDGDVEMDVRVNENAGPVAEGEMNNNVMVKEELPMEQSSEEDSDDVEVEEVEEEIYRDEVKEGSVKRPEEEGRIEENEAAEGDKCDRWEDGGDASKDKVACEVCGKELCRNRVNSHMRFKHGWEATKCPRCSNKVYSLKFHKCQSKTTDQVECEVCGQCVSRKQYTVHMKAKHSWGLFNYPKLSCGHRVNRFINHVCGRKLKDYCSTGTAEESGALASPPAGAGAPPRTSGPRLDPGGSGGKPGGEQLARKRKSAGKAKPAMVAPAPACEYERIRAANIAEREAMFQSLGIQGHVREVKEK